MKKENNVLKLVYTFFVGLLVALFVGVGIDTFYTQPAAPEYPVASEAYGKEPTDEQIEAERKYEETSRDYEKDELRPYNRNVSVIVTIAAVALLAASIVFEKKIKVIADGIMLGGLFTLMYGIGRGFASQDSKYVFVIVSLGLAAAIYIGYRRFVTEHPETDSSRE